MTHHTYKDFKKAKEGKKVKGTKEAKAAATKLEISDKVFRTEMKPAKVTIKDHKEDCMNKNQTRLINPTKSNLGRVSKWKVEMLNKLVVVKTKLQQWKNTDATPAWFRRLENKSSLTFIVCDIVDLLPPHHLRPPGSGFQLGGRVVSDLKTAEIFHLPKNSDPSSGMKAQLGSREVRKMQF